MRANAGILLIICLLFLIGTVAAVGIPDTLIVTTDKPWIIANNVDQSTITVKVTNTTSPDNGDVQGVSVNLEVDPLYGTMSPTQVTTNLSGMASSIFKVNTKSGAVQINATITAPALSDSTIQNIDHTSAYFADFTHPMNGTVASEVPFTVSLTDQYRNPIDNRRGNHIINLHVTGPAPDDCGFDEAGYAHDISPLLDANGNTSVNVKLTSRIGDNNIAMDGYDSIPNKLQWISAEAQGKPYSMTGSISDGGILPVGSKFFTIDYFLFDLYGNPLGGSSVWVNSSEVGSGEQKMFTSNSRGQIRVTYGPKATVKNITLTATSESNPNVTKVLFAQFITAEATNMVLAITPQNLPSRDIPTSQPAQVVGKVTDFFGNPVAGQLVSFSLSDVQTSPFVATGSPSFNSGSVVSTISATTNSDGNAIVSFYPGSFTIQQNDPNYSDKASGSCKVTATWNSYSPPPVTMEWKNFPYLSVSVNATPQHVQVNDTVDVSINVKGDGYMMGTRPITVMLDMDASSSLNSGSRGPDAKASSKKFVDNLTMSLDQVGLVSYGDDDNEVFHSNASYNFFNVKESIDNLTLQGGVSGKYISVAESVHEAATRIITNPTNHTQEVRAIILLGDSGYQASELPTMVKETWTDNNIRVFTIVFLSSGGGCGSTTDNKLKDMKALADQAGGKYYCGADKNAIDNAYAEIAGILRSLAGVNATMDLSFDNVEVNSTPMSGGLVFDYIPETKTTWPNSTITYKNQSEEWKSPDYQLHFDIGTLHINEMWESQYRLKVKQTGLIKLFDNTSKLTFNNGTETLKLPEIYITSVPSYTPIGSTSGTLDVSNLVVTKSGRITDLIPVNWNLKYLGIATVDETMWYSYNNGPWVLFSSQTNISPGDFTHNAQLDVRKLPDGYYRIKVHAIAPDSVDDEAITNPIKVGGDGTFIKLE